MKYEVIALLNVSHLRCWSAHCFSA